MNVEKFGQLIKVFINFPLFDNLMNEKENQLKLHLLVEILGHCHHKLIIVIIVIVVVVAIVLVLFTFLAMGILLKTFQRTTPTTCLSLK